MFFHRRHAFTWLPTKRLLGFKKQIPATVGEVVSLKKIYFRMRIESDAHARMRTFDRATNVWNQLFILYSFSNLS